MAFVGSLSGSGGASNTINVTGSMIIANPGTGGLFPSFPGSDTVFFVSGAIDGKTAGSRTVSVFGGDTVVSGSLTIGTGSIRIDSNEIRFQGGVAKIVSGSGGLTFFDSGSPSGVTLATLAAGGGGSGDVVGPAGATGNAVARFDSTTGKLIKNSLVTISDLATDTVTLVGDASATTITLFDTVATTVNFAGGASTATNIGNASGLTTIAGDLKVAGNDIQSSTGATAITLSGGNVIIPGDLTVNGTTTTVNTENLLVEDPLIYFGSGSVGSNRDGGIALASGSSVTDQALVWGRVAADTWGAGRFDVQNGILTDLTSMTLLPIRSSKLELGGSTTFVTSSDGTSLTAGTTGVITLSGSQTQIFSGPGGIALYKDGTELGGIDSAGPGQIAINAASTTTTANLFSVNATTVNIAAGGPTARAVNVGTSTMAVQTVTVGSTNSTSALTLQTGTGAMVLTAGGSYAVNATTAATIDSSAGAIGIGTAANNQQINVGTAGNRTITIGSDSATTTLSLKAGPGQTLDITGNATANISIGPNNSVGTIKLGQSTDTNTIAIGNANTADTKTQTINIGAGTPVSTGKALITIGNTNGASATNLKAGTGNITAFAHVLPDATNTYDLGAPDKRFRNMYTGDLHLRNERGDWTVIEEEDFLTLTNNKSGKRYKFVLEEI
jgi:hypothetical protein